MNLQISPQMPALLQSPIEYLKGVGPQRGEVLRKELGINTFGDLLAHYPFRYVDRSIIHQIKQYTEFYIKSYMN